MAALALAIQVMAALATVTALLWQIRDLQRLITPLRADRERSRPVPGLSVVLLADIGSDSVEASVTSILSQNHPDLELVVVLAPPSGAGQAADSKPGRRPARRRPSGAGQAGDAAARHGLPGDPRLRVIELGPPPVGWMRRPHAFYSGFKATSRPWVLFVDEDILFKHSGLVRAADTADWHGADLFTLLPETTATTWLERLMMPFLLQLNLLARSLVHSRDLEAFPGIGPFQLFRRTAYEAVGGHGGVRNEHSDDLALARRVQASGRRLVIGHGVELAVVQGQTSLSAIWRSWARSFNEAISNSRWRAVGAAALLLAVFALPWLLLAVAPVALATSSTPAAASPWTGVLLLGAANVLVAIAHRRALRDGLRVDDSLVWLQPLAATLTAAMLVASTLHLEGGRLAPWVERAVGLADRAVASRR